MKINKQLLRTGLKILRSNPSLIKSFFSGSFDNVYCSYWYSKLPVAKKYSQETDFSADDFFDKIKEVNSEILNSPYSRIESYFIPLYLLIRKLKPAIVIETGVHRGVSSFFILQAFEENNHGMLYSIDLPFASYETDTGVVTKSGLSAQKTGVCVPKELRKRWNLILGDSKIELPKILEKCKTVDFFIHDSQHTYEHMMWEFDTAWPHIRNGGILISDDTHWNNSFNDFVNKKGCKSIQLQRDRERQGTFGIILKKEY